VALLFKNEEGGLKMEDDLFGEAIYSYTRKQALEDGVLIDVTDLAKEAAFRYPVAVTARVWYKWIVPPEEAIGQDEKGRLWDLLNVLRFEAKKAKGDRVDFKVLFDQGNDKRLVDLYSLCGPGDDLEPVITIMLIGED
jgi:hypothetical protein